MGIFHLNFLVGYGVHVFLCALVSIAVLGFELGDARFDLKGVSSDSGCVTSFVGGLYYLHRLSAIAILYLNVWQL